MSKGTNGHQDPSPITADVGYLSIDEIHTRFASGALTPAEVVATLTNRIGELNFQGSTELTAVIEIDVHATKQAASLSGPDNQALWGIPLLIKDNFEVQGWTSGAGSTVFTEPAVEDAPVIARLRQAGAIMLANCNMTEWASASSGALEEGYSTRGGLTGNPWALDRSAGGSSSGSAAAVAAGFAPVALGTETIGSITQPASHCGVYAMKATRGAVSNEGIVPYSRTQDVPGVFSRNLEDLRIVMSVMADQDLTYSDDVSIGFLVDDDLNDVRQTPAALAATYAEFSRMLSLSGNAANSIPRVSSDLYEKMFDVLFAELNRDLSGYLAARPGSRWTSLSDALDDFANLGKTHVARNFPNPPRDGFEKAVNSTVVNIEVERAEVEKQFTAILEKLLKDDEVVLAPAYAPAPKSDLKRGYIQQGLSYMSYLDGLSSVVGWPSITVPFIQVDGLPSGLIMIARPGGESALLGAARSLNVEFHRPNWASVGRG